MMRFDDSTDARPPAILGQERLLLVGGSAATIDLLRLATVRSENVVLVASAHDKAVARYARHFGVAIEMRGAVAEDFDETDLVIVATRSAREDGRAMRLARRRGIPVHVFGQPHLSDFSIMGMLEWHPSSIRAGAAHDAGGEQPQGGGARDDRVSSRALRYQC
jgi:siroheme synthase (precorrin-2 oxidase/ferrochelatase)